MNTSERGKIQSMADKLKSLSKDSDKYKSQLLEIRKAVDDYGYHVFTEAEVVESVADYIEVEEKYIPVITDWEDEDDGLGGFYIGGDRNLIALDYNGDGDTLYVYDPGGTYLCIDELGLGALGRELRDDYEGKEKDNGEK